MVLSQRASGLSLRMRRGFRSWAMVRGSWTSRLEQLSVRWEYTALFENGFQIKVTGIGDTSKPGRYASKNCR